MDIVRSKESNVQIDLHDARINEIKIKESGVRFSIGGASEVVAGELEDLDLDIFFEGMNADDCDVYVFEGEKRDKEFSGKRVSLVQFAEEFGKDGLEIVTEAYAGNDYIWEGMIYRGEKIQHFIMMLWSQGNMRYKLKAKAPREVDRDLPEESQPVRPVETISRNQPIASYE